MKISHESPLALLQISRAYNDYDYALVHLFEKYPEYYKFFEESLLLDRTVILDNSIFELGTAFDADEFYKWVLKLNPTYFIIPDVFDNGIATVKNVKEWVKKYGEKIHDSQAMAVAQGSTPAEFLDCYQTLYKMGISMIAFPVNSKSYLNGKEYTPQNMMEGRYMMVNACLNWLRSRPWFESVCSESFEYLQAHHLLGLSLPQEVALYKDIPEIVSIDTSNPVLHGMEGIWYDEDGCLDTKSSGKMHEMMEWVISKNQFDTICHNITKFRSHVN